MYVHRHCRPPSLRIRVGSGDKTGYLAGMKSRMRLCTRTYRVSLRREKRTSTLVFHWSTLPRYRANSGSPRPPSISLPGPKALQEEEEVVEVVVPKDGKDLVHHVAVSFSYSSREMREV